MRAQFEAAQELREFGLSTLPSRSGDKGPRVKWSEYKTRRPFDWTAREEAEGGRGPHIWLRVEGDCPKDWAAPPRTSPEPGIAAAQEASESRLTALCC